MKPKAFGPSVSLLAFTALGLATATSSARPPRASEACGVLQIVDGGAHRLALLPTGNGKPLVADWKPDTSFIRGGEFDRADSLKEGARVCVLLPLPLLRQAIRHEGCLAGENRQPERSRPWTGKLK